MNELWQGSNNHSADNKHHEQLGKNTPVIEYRIVVVIPYIYNHIGIKLSSKMSLLL